VAIGIFDHQIEVPPFIYIVEKREGGRQSEYANSGE